MREEDIRALLKGKLREYEYGFVYRPRFASFREWLTSGPWKYVEDFIEFMRDSQPYFYVGCEDPDEDRLASAIEEGMITRVGEDVYRVERSYEVDKLVSCFFLQVPEWSYWTCGDRQEEEAYSCFAPAPEEELTVRVQTGEIGVAVCAYGDGVEMRIVINKTAVAANS